MKQLKLGITGAGSFGQRFIPLFQAHPNVSELVIAEEFPERRNEVAKKFGIREVYDSHSTMCNSDIDAVVIITQRHLHAPQAIEALKKGKHVYTAVPAACTMEEIEELVKTVEETGLMYMMGETSYYYPSALYCRDRFNKGDFGDFVYGEGEYLHDMSHGFYRAFKNSGGENWRRVAGFPPMNYVTHSTSMIISVTGCKLDSVSCLGYVDKNDDGVFGEGKNLWNNPFSNQTALFRTSDGGMCRINEFRRVGHGGANSVRTSIFGTNGSFEEQANQMVWTNLNRDLEVLDDKLSCGNVSASKTKSLDGGEQEDFYSDVSSVHPVERLPKEFTGLSNGHFGSHQFLTDDFVRSVVQEKHAPNHVWAAARYTIPGIIAHESAKKEGEQMVIPDFGDKSGDVGLINYDSYSIFFKHAPF